MKNKKLFRAILIIILLILIIYLLYDTTFSKSQKDNLNTESTYSLENSPFSISKVIMYSSASGTNKSTTFQQNNWILDIFQYSDIAIYLTTDNNELNPNNTIQKLSIQNVSISNTKVGTPSLYYLDTLNFGTPNINNHYIIEDNLEFTILNDKNIDTNLQYNTPIFFTDCSNPITLKYVNNQIKTDFEITSNEPIFFNGKLLELAKIPLENLETTISFDIHFTANDNKEYKYTLNLPIELKNDTNNILEGSILTEKNSKQLQ